MEQNESANRQIDVASYTKTTPVKIIAGIKVLKALLAAAVVVLLIIYAGSISLAANYLITDLSTSMQSITSAAAGAFLIRIFGFLLQIPVIPALIACAVIIVEAVGYVNLVSSDHGEKPIRFVSRLRMILWLLSIIAIILSFVSEILSLDQKTIGNMLILVLLCLVCLIIPFFYYLLNRDIANIMLTIENERASGSLQYAGGKGLLWKATLCLILAVFEIFIPALYLLFGGIGAVTNMISNIGNGANMLESVFQAGGTVFSLVLAFIGPICKFMIALAGYKAAQSFNKLH